MLYTAASNLTDIQNQIKNNSRSLAVSQVNQKFIDYTNDITLTTSSSVHGNNDVTNVLSQWRGWTDANQNMFQKGCSSSTKDQWAQNQTKCSSGYSYINAGSSSIGSNYCLIYPEWSSSQVTSRYSTQPSGCSPSGSSDFTSVQSAASAYFNSVTSYTTNNKNLLTKLTATNNDLDSSFSQMANNLYTSIGNINGILNPLIKIFNSILGQNGFFTLINCCKY